MKHLVRSAALAAVLAAGGAAMTLDGANDLGWGGPGGWGGRGWGSGPGGWGGPGWGNGNGWGDGSGSGSGNFGMNFSGNSNMAGAVADLAAAIRVSTIAALGFLTLGGASGSPFQSAIVWFKF